jgi:hypothetical protein
MSGGSELLASSARAIAEGEVMNRQRSGALVEFIGILALVAGIFAAGLAHGAPLRMPNPDKANPDAIGVIEISIDSEPLVLIFLSGKEAGVYSAVSFEGCAQNEMCAATFIKLAEAHKLDRVNIHTAPKVPDIKS